MGNTFPVQLKGGESYNISAEKIQELYYQIRHVDDSMCGFVKTLDSLRSAGELFLRHCDKRHDKLNESQDSKDEWETVLTDEDLAVNLLKTLEESVCDQKRPAIESLAKLLNCLVDAGTDLIDESKSDDTVLSLDLYLSKEKEKEMAIENITFTNGRIESLRKQLKLEKELNLRYIKDKEHLEERDKHTRKELDILRGGKTQMEKRLKRLKEEYAQLETEYKSLQIKLQDVSAENKENEKRRSMINTETKVIAISSIISAAQHKESNINDLRALKDELHSVKSELNWFKRKQYIHVQVYRSGISVTLVDMLLENIQSKLEATTFRLHVIKLDAARDFKDVTPDVPVLLFMSNSELIWTAPNTLLKMDGFTEQHKVALVVLHRCSRSSNVTKSEDVHLGDKFKNLGGIFHIVYDVIDGIYECETNKKNCQRLYEFVEKRGVEKSVIETYDLMNGH